MGNKFATGDVAGMRGIAALFVQAQAADINLVNFVFEKIQYIFDVAMNTPSTQSGLSLYSGSGVESSSR